MSSNRKAQKEFSIPRVVKLEEIPKDIYLDENKHIHVIVQTYVLAPYATGTIDVDLDKE